MNAVLAGIFTVPLHLTVEIGIAKDWVNSTECQCKRYAAGRSAHIKLLPGTLPIKGRMLFGIKEVIGIECSHMRQQ